MGWKHVNTWLPLWIEAHVFRRVSLACSGSEDIWVQWHLQKMFKRGRENPGLHAVPPPQPVNA